MHDHDDYGVLNDISMEEFDAILATAKDYEQVARMVEELAIYNRLFGLTPRHKLKLRQEGRNG